MLRVAVVMGSDSDYDVMVEAAEVLRGFGIECEITVASAHRSPARAIEFARGAKERGIGVIIAGAGMAAHLAGALAANTTVPVIGVPINASPLGGLDALLATVQMPPGVPVATVAVGESGAKNAGFLAAQILSLGNEELAERLEAHREEMARSVEEDARKVEEKGGG